MKLVSIKRPQIAWVLLGVSAGLHFLLPQSHRHDFACWGCGIVGVAIGFGLIDTGVVVVPPQWHRDSAAFQAPGHGYLFDFSISLR